LGHRAAERRGLQLERLEDRLLLAIGPQLISIQPNSGNLLQDGAVRDIAPNQLTFVFDEGQVIDASTLAGIRLTRSGFDGVIDGNSDVVIQPGYIDVDPLQPNQVIVRFGETLPDDLYRIEVFGVDDVVSGLTALRNEQGDAFRPKLVTTDRDTINFELDLGAQIVSVVPQPVTRDVNGVLAQARNQIAVYFDDDDLNPSSAQNPDFYQLIFTNDTATNTDDVVHRPTSVQYSAVADRAVLTFASDLVGLSGPGVYRLRIGTDEALPLAPQMQQLAVSATTDFNTDDLVLVRFTARVPVGSGNAISLAVTKSDRGPTDGPGISISGRAITIDLNTNAAARTTAEQLVAAWNADPAVAPLVLAEIPRGVPGADIASPAIVGFPILLVDPGSAFVSAENLGPLGEQSRIISSEVETQYYPFDLPGGNDDPGHRPVTHVPDNSADQHPGIVTRAYNFDPLYGTDPRNGQQLFNLITEVQKQRAREVLEIWGHYLGVQFFESLEDDGVTIATGVPGAVTNGPTAILDANVAWNDAFGLSDDPLQPRSWFAEMLQAVGVQLGLNSLATATLPQLQFMEAISGVTLNDFNEPVFPGDHDLVHGRHLHRNEGKDIDLYRFALQERGVLTLETFAERLPESSLLDTVLTLFVERPDGTRELIARNDDYFSEDSFLQLALEAGTYFVGVSSTGNTNYDPSIEDTGFGGTTEGRYDLRLNFRPAADRSIVDATGTEFDGNADGLASGVFNFWLQAAALADTVFVDKSAPAGGNGTLASPLNNLAAAFAGGLQPGDIVRIVGNGGGDGNLLTLDDNWAYEIGFDVSQAVTTPLSDGTTLEVPQGVTVMVDAGAIFKLRNARIGVGSSAPGVARNAGALQVLGAPRYLDAGGNVIRDNAGNIIPGNVLFTSYDDESLGVDTNPLSTTPAGGNWGGIVFRNDLDRAEGLFEWEQEGIFLNYVNHADMRYGGGLVVIDSAPTIITPIQMIDARPTITFNTIRFSADAALAANPDSFEETNFHEPRFQATPFTADYVRIGPDIHGNRLVDNSINALFVRIPTQAGRPLERMTVSGRWDDTDVVHVVAENLIIDSTPGGPQGTAVFVPGGETDVQPGVGTGVDFRGFETTGRLDARLSIDPGLIVKLGGGRIETALGAQFLAEGAAGRAIIFTSLADDRYGAGGTFDTTSDENASQPAPGDWAGIYIGLLGSASIDRALISYAGGINRIEGNFAGFNAIEVHQADVRIAHSTLQFNADGSGGDARANRAGRGPNAPGVIFVRGAQPAIVNNTIRDNNSPVINVNANALNHDLVSDPGRATGLIDLATSLVGFQFGRDNQGPLVQGNRLTNNAINGMVVRGGTLTTESVWDDVDIAHVLQDEIVIPNHHSFGGLRLQSSAAGSLVVKLQSLDPLGLDPDVPDVAGFTASGAQEDIPDRIGGRLYIIGQPGFPVILTSLADDSVGAGLQPDLTPLTDTNNDGSATTPQPGDWRSVRIAEFAHDRNVQIVKEFEPADTVAPGTNAVPTRAEFLGTLAPSEKGGDENRRLGFEVHGFLNAPRDLDVYSFNASAGTEIWLDIDRTSDALDAVVELIDASGVVLARSDNSLSEDELLESVFRRDSSIAAFTLRKSAFLLGHDRDTFNPRDAGLRVVLPGAAGSTNTYHVRVRSSSRVLASDLPDLDASLQNGQTSGIYRLQIRLQEADEFPGSTVRLSSIRYATNGVEVFGQPTHSPLTGEATEDSTSNDALDDAQPVGDVFASDRAVVSVNGGLTANDDQDWYRFTASGPMTFDIDYADGFSRPNTTLSIFDSSGRLVLYHQNSKIADDVPRPLAGSNLDDLSRGSLGALDPFVGTVNLPAGDYLVVVSGDGRNPSELTSNALTRLEPLDSIVRIVEDHVDSTGGSTAADPVIEQALDDDSSVPFHLGDVVLFVTRSTGSPAPDTLDTVLHLVDPFTGTVETTQGTFGYHIGDIAFRADDTLVAFSRGDAFVPNGPTDANSGSFLHIDPGTAAATVINDDGILTYQRDPADASQSIRTHPIPAPNGTRQGDGIQFHAVTFLPDVELGERLFAVGDRGFGANLVPGPDYFENILYQFCPDGTNAACPEGTAFSAPDPDRADDPDTPPGVIYLGAGTQIRDRGELLTSAKITAADATLLVNPGPNEFTRFNITDGQTFIVDDGLTQTTFEFELGFDIAQDINVDQAQTIRDGNFFILDPDATLEGDEFYFQVNTGTVIAVIGNGADISDGQTLTVNTTDPDVPGVNFEFDDDGTLLNENNVAISVAANMGPGAIAVAIANAINDSDLSMANVTARVALNRVSLVNDFSISLGPSSTGIRIEGGNGAAPILRALHGGLLADGQTFRLTTTAANNVPFVFEFESGYTIQVPAAGGAAIADGATFSISQGAQQVTFEFNSAGGATGDVVIPFTALDTAETLAAAIRNAIAGAGLGLSPTDLLDGRVHVGGDEDTVLLTAGSGLAQNGVPGVTAGSYAIPFVPAELFTDIQVAAQMASAIDEASALATVLVAQPGANIIEGTSFTVNDDGTLVTFVFDNIRTGAVPGGGIAVPYDPGVPGDPNADPPVDPIPGDTANQVAQKMVNAINANTDVMAALGLDGRVLVDSVSLFATTQLVNNRVVVNGQGIAFTAGTSPIRAETPVTQIALEEVYGDTIAGYGNDTAMEIGERIARAVTNNPRFTAGARFDRINFLDADTIDIAGMPVWTLFGGERGVAPGNEPVRFLVSDQAAQSTVPADLDDRGGAQVTVPGISDRIATAINSALSPEITATAVNQFVRLSRGQVTVSAPLTAQGDGPGGTITGLAQIGGVVYAVSDAGGLFIVRNPFSRANPITPRAFTEYVESSANDLTGIEFAGLTAGPQNVEGGRYANLLFAIDTDGRLYAFNTSGQLQPIFLDGATSAATGLANVHGLAFSSLDRNPWYVTVPGDTRPEREGDAGHGLVPTVTDSRTVRIAGNSSYHFGRGQNGNYNFPGGAHGTLVTNEFSLEGYGAADEPTLYFNYFLATEDANARLNDPSPPAPMRDAFRVFIAGDDGDWKLLATNNSARGDAAGPAPLETYDDEFDYTDFAVQELLDNTGAWRQARIDLAPYAGLPNLRLRFDFSTAASMNLGDITTTGAELRAVAASQIRDGQTLTIDDLVFEFELGYTIVAPTGASIADGETLTLEDGVNPPVTFEFDRDGVVADGHVAVLVSSTQTAANAALLLSEAINAAGLPGVRAILVPDKEFDQSLVDTNRINLDGVQSVTQELAPAATQLAIGLEGAFGVQPESIPVPLDGDMTRFEVADALDEVLEQALTDPAIIAANGLLIQDGDTFTLSDGQQEFVFEFDSGFVLTVPAGASLADADTFELSDGLVTQVFEFDKDGIFDPLNQQVAITEQSTPLAVTRAIEAAVGAAPLAADLGLSATVLSGARTQIFARPDVTLTINSSAIGFDFTGQPGVAEGHLPVRYEPSSFFSAADVAAAIADAVNNSGTGLTATQDAAAGSRVRVSGTVVALTPPLTQEVIEDVVKQHLDLVRVIGHTVTDAGPLGFDGGNLDTDDAAPDTTVPGLPGDEFGAFFSNWRARNNTSEGVYLDDLIIGFAERGELVTGTVVNTAFTGNATEDGSYQLEIRRASQYMSGNSLVRSFDTNDRLVQDFVLDVPHGFDLADEQKFLVSDGVRTVEFVFRDLTPVTLVEASDTLAEAFDTGIVAGVETTFRGAGEIGDNFDLPLANDVDLLRLELRAGDRFTIDVDAAENDSELDAYLRLFRQTSPGVVVQIAANDHAAGPDEPRTSDPFLDFVAPATGVYFVGISSSPNQAYNPALAGSGVGSSTGAYTVEIRVGASGGLGPTAIAFDASDRNYEIARRILNAINGSVVQSLISMSAATADGAFLADETSTSHRLNIFGDLVLVGNVVQNLRNETETATNDTIPTAVESGLTPGLPGTFLADGVIGDNPRLAGVSELDVDFVQLALLAGDIVTIDIDAATVFNPTSPTSRLDSAIAVFDEEGNLLAENDDDPETSVLWDSLLTFTAPETGNYFVAISSADKFAGNPLAAESFDPFQEGSLLLTSSVSAGFFRLRIDVGPGTMPFVQFDEEGDRNRFRDQGQILIHSNSITDSLQYGIVADAGARDDSESPHAGPVRTLREINVDALAPGVVIANNLVAGSGEGGIFFSGDPSPAGSPQANVPFGRIINNTLFGQGGNLLPGGAADIGITIGENASPTLMNNIVANFDLGISVDGSSSIVAGGALFQGNNVNSNTNLGSFSLVLASDDPLFVSRTRRNFYPASMSMAIDSSIDSIEDRFELVTVKSPLGIPVSPVLAPARDVFGQLRVDDPAVNTPPGIGDNVFKDRGAVDRVDFIGPVAQLIAPQDNDSQGIDQNPADNRVLIEDVTLSQFVIQLTDLADVSGATGVGIDNDTVSADSVRLFRDDELLSLVDGYRFNYNATNKQILLTPQAGIWLPGFTYTVELINRDQFVATAPDGAAVADGESFTITDLSGTVATFEFESGFTVAVPETLKLVVPAEAAGPGGITDGERFSINAGLQSVVFEFDNNNAAAPNVTRVPFTASDTVDQIANSIVLAIASAPLGLAPTDLGSGVVHVGGGPGLVLDTASSALTQSGSSGAILDGERFVFSDGIRLTVFEFDNDQNTVTGQLPVRFTNNDSDTEIADAIVAAVANAGLGLNPVNVGGGRVNLGGSVGWTLNTAASSLVQSGTPGVSQPGAVPIVYIPSAETTGDQMGELIAAAIAASPLTGVTAFPTGSPELLIQGATNVDGITSVFTPAIQDLAGNPLKPNQDAEPFQTLLVIEMPADEDFGDAPDPPYPTLRASGGARHIIVPTVFLGSSIDAEEDGQPTTGADGDNDDGVVFNGPLVRGGGTPLTITASAPGFLNAWIDFNGNGVWDHPAEQILADRQVAAGSNLLVANIPDTALVGTTYARFRYNTTGGLLPTGRADNGEVEDYQVGIIVIPPPEAEQDSYSVAEDEELAVAAATGVLSNDTDPQGDPLTAVLVNDVSHGTLSFNDDGSFVYQPDPDFFGDDLFTYFATDGAQSSQETTVIITVTSVLDAPVAEDDPAATDEDVPVLVNVIANDRSVDGVIVSGSVTLVDLPSQGTVELHGDGTLTYSPEEDFFGTDTFTYTITSDLGLTSAPATVTITVNEVNDPPVAVNDSESTTEGAALRINVIGNDIDVDGFIPGSTVALVAFPKRGTVVNHGDGTVTYTPEAGFQGTDQFRYTVRDDDGALSNQAVVSVTVFGDNIPPTAVDDLVSTPPGIALTINVVSNDFDTDGTVVAGSVAVTTAPTRGTLVNHGDGTLRYTPNAGFQGTDTFFYTVRDDEGALSNQATVTINVTTQNIPPTAVSDSATARPDRAVVINVVSNDFDTDGVVVPSTVAITQNPAHGGVVNNGDGTVTYTPGGGFLGTDTFQYTVRDEDGALSNQATVTVLVSDAPPVWHNAASPLNVNNDVDALGMPIISNIDALLVINELNSGGSRTLPGAVPPAGPPPFLDVNADDYLSPIDALLVINELNRLAALKRTAPAPAAEGEMPSPSASELALTYSSVIVTNQVRTRVGGLEGTPLAESRGTGAPTVDRVFAHAAADGGSLPASGAATLSPVQRNARRAEPLARARDDDHGRLPAGVERSDDPWGADTDPLDGELLESLAAEMLLRSRGTK